MRLLRPLPLWRYGMLWAMRAPANEGGPRNRRSWP